MAIVRVVKNKDYTVMSNTHLKDKRLSLKAIGLLSVVLGLPEDWHYTVNGLVGIVKDGKDSVETAIKELKKNGYLRVEKIYPNGNSNRIQYQYTFFENPQEVDFQPLEKQGIEKQGVETQVLENPYTYKDTNKQNTKELNTNNSLGEKGKKETVNSVIAEYTENKDLQDALHGFVEMRNKARKPLTARAMKLSLNKLNELALDDVTKIDIVNQSIVHSWLTFYKLQNNNNGGQRQLTRKEMGYAF